ncbi:NAD(P)/FAD-dependent oxidoreductase [Adhaeribacter rhizoryzae]|uniref:FAD-dependent oxidoreductase n=1 Tax=Adhaeribacter rhizoryzae TaxID=2607907 RepID=A0A5M6DB97_9BACT|nr:FAD/NAD(P)-binding oxidoreductase [Adhaeribacter rhizoryzae]KAA5544834.1 FAD-dependent oxidoreductase [Adhaeribacter rhizoryzae]
MRVIIIGNGVTGVTAATTIRKLDPTAHITIISAESEHFFSRTALMYLYMGHMQYRHIKPYEDWFWPERNINLLHAAVQSVDFNAKQVILENHTRIDYDKLLLATGSLPRTLGIPGENLAGVQGFYSLHDLAQLEQYSANIPRAVIVGGGLIGIELAEMFYTRCIPVTFLVREPYYWGNILPEAEGTLIQEHIRAHGIDLRLNTTVSEITGDAEGRVKSIITNKGEEIAANLVGVAVGVKPNVSFLENSDLKINRGVLVNQYLETNLPDVYAAGDCAEILPEPENKPVVEQLWYTGRMQGETVAHSICNRRTVYNRGIWFNSAKFFDIEYQTYGQVPAVPAPETDSLLWQHPKEKKLVRINYHQPSGKVLGFNLLGIRYRHEVCEKWLKEEKPISYVLKHLREANFDPEFYRRHEKEIIRTFSRQLSAVLS